MTKYITIDNVTKQEVIIDPEHFDGKGELANIGNWMVDYIDQNIIEIIRFFFI